VYRHHAIVDKATLREGAARLQRLHDLQDATDWTAGAFGVVVLATRRRSVRVQSESRTAADRRHQDFQISSSLVYTPALSRTCVSRLLGRRRAELRPIAPCHAA
jgi:hypothetical protein